MKFVAKYKNSVLDKNIITYLKYRQVTTTTPNKIVITKANEMARIAMTKCKSFSIIYISGNCSVCNVKSENTVIRTISVTGYIKYDNL